MTDTRNPSTHSLPLNEDRDAVRWAREFNEKQRGMPTTRDGKYDEGWLIGIKIQIHTGFNGHRFASYTEPIEKPEMTCAEN